MVSMNHKVGDEHGLAVSCVLGDAGLVAFREVCWPVPRVCRRVEWHLQLLAIRLPIWSTAPPRVESRNEALRRALVDTNDCFTPGIGDRVAGFVSVGAGPRPETYQPENVVPGPLHPDLVGHRCEGSANTHVRTVASPASSPST